MGCIMGMRVSLHLSHFKAPIPLHEMAGFYRYRNFEMACTALMDQPFQPLYFPLLDSPIPPSVRNLQKTIEEAWKAGTTMSNHRYRGLIRPLFQDSILKEPNS
jgi:hypothetical protein